MVIKGKAASSLLLKIAIGFLLGIALGFFVGPMIPENPFLKDYFVPFCDVLGRIFLTLLRMLIVPLVFASLVAGAASMGQDLTKMGRIGAKVMSLYFFTTFIAVGIGLAFSTYVQPGMGINIAGADWGGREGKPLLEVFMDIFPSNPIQSMFNANMLQIMVFALFFGVAAALIANSDDEEKREYGKRVIGSFKAIAEVMFSLVGIVMKFAPYGVFALIFNTASRFGIEIIAPFAKVIFCVYAGCIVHLCVVYIPMILYHGHSPSWYLKGIQANMLTGFVTRSSAATLPITIENTRNNLGVSEELCSFALPVGMNINMDGTAVYQGVAVLFVAQAYGLDLTFNQQLTAVLTATFAALGAAGVPGAGLIMLTMVLTAVGIPLEGIALMAGIDVILDSARTCLNVSGDPAVCVLVAGSEGEVLSDGLPARKGD